MKMKASNNKLHLLSREIQVSVTFKDVHRPSIINYFFSFPGTPTSLPLQAIIKTPVDFISDHYVYMGAQQSLKRKINRQFVNRPRILHSMWQAELSPMMSLF